MKRWQVILIAPKEGGNVGAAARVLKNFGAGGLRVVAPRCEVNGPESRRFSAGAAEILRAAPVFETLAEAIADLELTVGLTGVPGRHHRVDCAGLVPTEVLRERDNFTRCGLVFGREERGMESDELESLDFLWSLPTNTEFPSLNLAQAIGVALSGVAEAERQLGVTSLGRGLAKTPHSLNPMAGGESDQPATQEELAHLGVHFRDLMLRTGWDDGRRTVGSLVKLRNLLARGRATQREVNLLHGICKQSIDAVNHPERFRKK
ncbi:RNA methyltransferase [soil metagenome]